MRFNYETEEIGYENEGMDVLSELPIELEKTQIKAQMILPSNNNFVETMLEKMEDVLRGYGEDPDTRASILEQKQEFLVFVINQITETFGIGVDVDADNLEELETVAVALYEGLIIHFERNIKKFFYNYIVMNKEALSDEYEECLSRGSFNNKPKQTENLDMSAHIVIVALPAIMKSLYDLNRDISPMDFLQISGLDKLYCGSIIKEKYENGTLCGSFVDQYMEILNGEKEPFRQDLYAYLSMALMTEFGLIKR